MLNSISLVEEVHEECGHEHGRKWGEQDERHDYLDHPATPRFPYRLVESDESEALLLLGGPLLFP